MKEKINTNLVDSQTEAPKGEIKKEKVESPEDVFKEFEDFVAKNPDAKIPAELEQRYANAEKNLVETKKEEPKSLMTIGEERYQAIGKSFGNFGKRLSAWGEKAGKFLKSTAFGVLVAPDAIGRGTQHVAEGTISGTVAGAKYVGKKLEEGVEKVEKRVEKFGDSVEKNVINPVYNFTTENYQKAEKFTKENYKKAVEFKKETKIYLGDKALTLEAVATLMGDKTVEKLKKAEIGIEKSYNGVIKYGKSAVETNILRAWYAKDSFNKKKNSIFMKISEKRKSASEKIFEKKEFIRAEKERKARAKILQLQKVVGLEAQFVA